MNRVSKFYSDGSFFYPQIRLLEKITSRIRNNIYFYNFGYRGALNMATIGEIKGNTGVTHGDDVLYLFPVTSTFTTTNANFTAGDEKISRLMVDFWTSFATNGYIFFLPSNYPNSILSSCYSVVICST